MHGPQRKQPDASNLAGVSLPERKLPQELRKLSHELDGRDVHMPVLRVWVTTVLHGGLHDTGRIAICGTDEGFCRAPKADRRVEADRKSVV